jgi:hypothetical protein
VVDPALDIDSPFLDLFGDAPQPAPLGTAAAQIGEPEFELDLDVDEPAAPASAPPDSGAVTPAPSMPTAPEPINEPPVAPEPVNGGPGPAISLLKPATAPAAPPPPADDQGFTRAPVGPQADFFDDPGAPDSDYEDWPDEVRPGAPAVAAAPASPIPDPVAERPISTPPLWQTVAPPGFPPPAVNATAPPAALAAPSSDSATSPNQKTSADLPAPMPEKAPASRRSSRRARRAERKEPANLPAVRPKKDVKPAPLRPHKLKFSDRDPAIELAISEIAGHLTFTQSTVTAWYHLPEVRWAFRPDAEREALLSAISEQYAGLAGFRLHLRRTNRPFPADEWARTVDSFTAKPLPDVVGATSWSDHLVAAQRICSR